MWVSCPQTALLKAVQIVGRGISARTTMPILGYVLMETQKDGIKLTATDLELAMQDEFVATDGGRLALRKAQLPQAARQKIGVIVPAKAMQELARALAGVEGAVQLRMADNQLVFTVPGLRVYSRLISGQFPNYQQVIPQEFKQRIRVQTERLLRAVRRASITARDSANVVRLRAEGKKLTLTSNTPEVGKAREEVEVAAEGEPIEAAFNARYLMDCLNSIEAAELFLGLTGPLSPGAIRPAHHSDYVYVLAPVRVYS